MMIYFLFYSTVYLLAEEVSGYDQIQDGQKEPSRGNQFTATAETVARATNV